VARITRKELKTDKFAQEVGLTVTFFEEHQQDIVRYGGIAAAAILLIVGFFIYQRHEHSNREQALFKAIQVQETPVAMVSATGGPTFPTQDAKDQASIKAFTELAAKYPGTTEGEIGDYYLGAIKADQGKLAEAETNFRQVAQKADANYASLAKLSLAQIYFSDGRTAEGEKTLRDLMDHPTEFVSRDQATIGLARNLAKKNPAEARKLLQPMLTRKGAIAQVANSIYTELPSQ
jgi:predicted negative regulator of RcsB-dependent stress response